MTPKEIENYSIKECYDELEEINNPDLPPIQSMYHDMALDVINKRKQRIKQRLYQFDQALTELEELKRYPTSEEVCEALSKEFGHTYYYGEELRDFWCEEFGSDDHMRKWYLSNEPLNELVDYPNLITLIGRFYEGLG